MFCNSPSRAHFARCQRHSDEIAPKDGLALTPHQMELMHSKGVPISTSNFDSQYFDGDKSPSFDVPIDQQRGVDIAEVWNESVNARKKLSRRQSRKVNPNPVTN